MAIVHDCDRAADGRAFIVLEPLDGPSLTDLIRQEGPLPVKRALRLAFEIADGLQAAHYLVLGLREQLRLRNASPTSKTHGR